VIGHGTELQPIGLLSAKVLTAGDTDGLLKGCTEALTNDRELLAYLQGGTVVFAIMERTRDVIRDSFGTDGGSGVLTDGEYYWRGDAADYVGTYGVAPSEQFLRQVRSKRWPGPLSPERLAVVDAELYERRKGGNDPARGGSSGHGVVDGYP